MTGDITMGTYDAIPNNLIKIGTQAFTGQLATPYGKYEVDLFYDGELNENDIVSDNVVNDFLLHQMSGEIKSLETRLAALEGIINAN